MPRYPDALQLEVKTEFSSLPQVSELALAATESSGLGQPLGWAEPGAGKMQVATIEEIRRQAAQVRSALEIRFPEDRRMNLRGTAALGSPMGIYAIGFTHGDREKYVFATLERFVNMLRHLARSGLAKRGSVYRVEGGANALPEPPLADPSAYAFLVLPEDVAAQYEDPKVYWSSWPIVEDHGPVRLVARALKAASGAAFLREVQDQQWKLARAAKPKRTKYYATQLEEDERPIYMQGPDRLTPTGYDAAHSEAIFSTVVEPGEHIQGHEINAIRHLLQEQRLPDGRPISSVRIIFPDRAAAEREKRPLLDIGAKVSYLADSGALEELTV
jgi:hypothetical protein